MAEQGITVKLKKTQGLLSSINMLHGDLAGLHPPRLSLTIHLLR